MGFLPLLVAGVGMGGGEAAAPPTSGEIIKAKHRSLVIRSPFRSHVIKPGFRSHIIKAHNR